MADPIDHTEQLCQLTARTESLEQKVRELRAENQRLNEKREELEQTVQELEAENERLHEEREQMARAGPLRTVHSNGEET